MKPVENDDRELVHSSEGESSDSESDSIDERPLTPAQPKQPVFKNKEKVLVLASRGITHRYTSTYLVALHDIDTGI